MANHMYLTGTTISHPVQSQLLYLCCRRAPENADEFAAASKQPASARQARSALNWTRRAPGGAEAAAGPPARRLVVFVIGGASRSEMRVVHALSRSLGRDIILGSTSIETPTSFTDMLYKIGSLDE
ncbi:MAG: hypothetical protein WDW36_002793 [Sanguina aurantia]